MSYSPIQGSPQVVREWPTPQSNGSSPYQGSPQVVRGLYSAPNYEFSVVRLYPNASYYGAENAPQFLANLGSPQNWVPFVRREDGQAQPLGQRVSFVQDQPAMIPFVPYQGGQTPAQGMLLSGRISFVHSPEFQGPASLTPPQINRPPVNRTLHF